MIYLSQICRKEPFVKGYFLFSALNYVMFDSTINRHQNNMLFVR